MSSCASAVSCVGPGNSGSTSPWESTLTRTLCPTGPGDSRSPTKPRIPGAYERLRIVTEASEGTFSFFGDALRPPQSPRLRLRLQRGRELLLLLVMVEPCGPSRSQNSRLVVLLPVEEPPATARLRPVRARADQPSERGETGEGDGGWGGGLRSAIACIRGVGLVSRGPCVTGEGFMGEGRREVDGAGEGRRGEGRSGNNLRGVDGAGEGRIWDSLRGRRGVDGTGEAGEGLMVKDGGEDLGQSEAAGRGEELGHTERQLRGVDGAGEGLMGQERQERG